MNGSNKKLSFLFPVLLFSLMLHAQEQQVKAYPFELKDTLGYVHRLADFKGKTLVMDFWFTGCAGCVHVARMLREQVKPHFEGDSSVVFIAASLDVNFLQWKRSIRGGLYTSEGQVNLFTNGMGATHPIYKHYGFSGAPQLLVIDPEGYVVSKSVTYNSKELISLINEAKTYTKARLSDEDFRERSERRFMGKWICNPMLL